MEGRVQRGIARLDRELELEFEVSGDIASASLPVLLLRPLLGDLHMWGEFGRQLAAHGPVVAFNPRGVGGSTGRCWGVGTDELALDALRLTDWLGLRRFHVVGLSLGAMVACQLAVRAPERVGRLVLISGLARGRDLRLGQVLGLLRGRSQRASVGDEEAQLLARLLSKASWRRDPHHARAAMRAVKARPTPLRYLLATALAAYRHDLGTSAAGLPCPVLLVDASADRIVNARARARLARAFPQAERASLEGGHDPSLERPGELARIVIDFLGHGQA